MTTEIDPFLTNTSFLNEDKVKILQQNRAPSEKNMKKDSVIAYVHMTRDTPLPLYAPVHILDDPHRLLPSFLHLRKYLMDGLFFNQKANKNNRVSYSLKYKHLKKKKTFFKKK